MSDKVFVMKMNVVACAVDCNQTNQGIRNLTRAESEHLAGSDADHATRDLFESIATGNYPSWTFYIQVMTFAEAEHFRWNPFDLTKVQLCE